MTDTRKCHPNLSPRGAPADELPESEGLPESSSVDGTIRLLPQSEQLRNPMSVITFEVQVRGDLLKQHCSALSGCSAGDKEWFVRGFWEVVQNGVAWDFHQSTPDDTTYYGGREEIILWEAEQGAMFHLAESVRDLNHSAQNWRKGKPNWGKRGVVVSLMGDLPVTLYSGDRYASKCTALVATNWESESVTAALWEFCLSPQFRAEVRRLNQKMAVEVKTFLQVPFDLPYWEKLAAEKHPNGLPEPQSDDPTQWLFHGHPAGQLQLTSDSEVHAGSILQVAVARLAGYRWPAEVDPTLHLASEARAWVDRCKSLEKYADDDGVVPLVPMRGEPAAEGRVRDLLRNAFGGEWSGAKEATLLAAAAASNGGKTPAANLDDWLKTRCFAEHCALFDNRPFVWHIWDGRKKDGFGVLVHYHRLAAPNGEGRRLLEKITHGYLGDWISRQRDEVKANKAGADARLAASLDLQKKLEAILKGEPPHDIFVRWRPLHEQPIGWEPDINDGVRMNIRPFVEAGVLRDKVNVKWTKDRGQDPISIRPRADFPWFWDGASFVGDRVNDVHLSTAEKQAARDAKRVLP